MEWIVVGELANVVQLSFSLRLIYAIVAAAKSARMHKRNCRQFAQHLKMIANLLEQLKPQDVDEFPEYRETREPLTHLENCLKRALVLVENCRDKSYLYLIAMGWSIVGQFKDYQHEIDKYLRLIPLISLVENHKEKLRAIERDRRDYTLDEEARKIYSTLLKDDRTRDDAAALQKSLSKSYPGLGLERALREENEKLRKELHRKQLQMDLDQCDVIEHLLEITKTCSLSKEELERLKDLPTHSRTSTMDSIDLGAVMPPPPPPPLPDPRNTPPQSKGRTPQYLPDGSLESPRVPTHPPHVPRVLTNTPHVPVRSPHGPPHPPHLPTGNDRNRSGSENGRNNYQRWHNGLHECCMDPFLCVSTFCYPCGTFTNIAAVVSDGKITQELACHDLAFHSLYLGCCIYTCCFRRKLRKRFNISGGTCDDCWAHICCCCCALVQEWREIQACEEEGLKQYKMRVPSQQTMENYRPRPNPNNQERYTG